MTSSAPTSSLAIGASFARKASVAAAHIHINSRRVASPPFVVVVATRFATSTAVTNNLTTNNNRSTKLHSFRQIINLRTSARRFQPNTPIPNAVWKDILSMTLTSPSGFNLQPTHILLLRDAQLKSILSEHAMLGMGNKYRTLDASGIAVFCTDLLPGRRIDRIYQLEAESGVRDDGYMAVMKVASSFLTGEGSASSDSGSSSSSGGSSQSRISTFLKRTVAHALSPLQPMPTMEDVECWSYKNAGIASSIYTLAATAHGLSTCMMEGYDARRVKEILRVPDRYGIPLMVATGYDYCGEDARGKNLPEVVHADFFNGDDVVVDYDEEDAVSSRNKRRTPRLEMHELFFGDTFGEPLDFLSDNAIVNAEDAA